MYLKPFFDKRWQLMYFLHSPLAQKGGLQPARNSRHCLWVALDLHSVRRTQVRCHAL